jgi:predicted transglutaminase-like cysteine proteinase
MNKDRPARQLVKLLSATIAFSFAMETAPAIAAAGSPATDAVLGVEALAGTLLSLPQWSQMFGRYQNQAAGAQSSVWSSAIDRFRSLDLGDAIAAVNQFVNRAEYVPDQRRWSRGDFWETPMELLTAGGDCEDFAIAKYLLLRALGVPASSMRILVLRGSGGDEDHAVLLVQTGSGAVILDNQRSQTYRYSTNLARAVAYAFNDDGMWLTLGR